jgi:hypothetical protein
MLLLPNYAFIRACGIILPAAAILAVFVGLSLQRVNLKAQ